jgi:hypothetical protein
MRGRRWFADDLLMIVVRPVYRPDFHRQMRVAAAALSA